MQVHQHADGLWSWTVGTRTSAYLEHGDLIILVDPVLPPGADDRDRFARAIERDLARVGGPVHVLLTRQGHPRDAAALEAMTGALRWDPGMGQAPAGMHALPVTEGAVALWSPVHRALIVPDAPLAVGGMGMRPDVVIVTGAAGSAQAVGQG